MTTEHQLAADAAWYRREAARLKLNVSLT